MRTSTYPSLTPVGYVRPRISVRLLGWAPVWALASWMFASAMTGLQLLDSDPSSVAARLVLLAILTASILLHELGHAVPWTRAGHDVRVYVSPLVGACAPAADDARLPPRSELVMVLAGPFANLAVAGVVATAARYVSEPVLAGLNVLDVVVDLNLLLFFANLLPVLPLDGGRALHALFGLLPGSAARNVGRSFVATTSLVSATLTSVWMVDTPLPSLLVVPTWVAIAVAAALWLVDSAREILAHGRAWHFVIAVAAALPSGIALASMLQRFVSG